MIPKLEFKNVEVLSQNRLKLIIIFGLILILVLSFKYSLFIEYLNDGYMPDLLIMLLLPVISFTSIILFSFRFRLGWILILFQTWIFLGITASLIVLNFKLSNEVYFKLPFYLFVLFILNKKDFTANYRISSFWQIFINILSILISATMTTIYLSSI